MHIMPRSTARFLRLLALLACSLAGFVPLTSAFAQVGSSRYSSIVIDGRSGTVLSAASPDELRHPASLTKMMTLYMTFEALREGRISAGQSIPVSARAAAMPPSKLGLVAGSRITVEQAILALITKSANDVASALGELLGGNEERFGQMMTLRARALGMSNTTFRNASGLPNWEQVTTARDMARLGQRLVTDFPHEYRLFSVQRFQFGRRVIQNHNRILTEYDGADGIKTGYIQDSGFNLVASAVRSNVRLIGVVLGGASPVERNTHMMALLDRGFRQSGVPTNGYDTPAPRMPTFVSSAQAAPARPTAVVRQTTSRTRQVAARAPVSRQAAARTPAAPSRVAAASRWVVQVGAFPTAAAARQAAQTAARRMGEPASAVRIQEVRVRNVRHYRAQIVGLTQVEATRACGRQSRHQCSVVGPT